MAALLRRYRIRRITPEQLRACLNPPVLDLDAGYVAAQAERTRSLVRCLQVLAAEARRLEGLIQQGLGRVAAAEAAAAGADAPRL